MTDTSSGELELYFDFISPYAYLGWKQIHALAEKHGRTVRPTPVLFAALLAHGHTKGPAEIPAKRIYIFKDTLRTALVNGIPFAPPPSHPFNPLVALRAVSVIAEAERRRAIDALFHGAWAGGGGIETEEKVASALNEAGLDGAALVARAKEQPAKDALREQTDRAIQQGVFGVPTMRVGREIFWGCDSFAHLERHLLGNDPLAGVDLRRFATIQPSATRRMRT
jgi:2-hydroxychromene-2-carboxylate isomerase